MKKVLLSAALALATLSLITINSEAAVPQLINYQGRLTNNVGIPLNTTTAVVFRICGDSLGVTELWNETQPGVTISNGLFQVLLGSINPLSPGVFDGSKRWLSVQLQGEPAPTELIPIVSTAYAYRSIKADTAGYALDGGDNLSGWSDNGNVVRLQNAIDSVGVGTNTPTAKLDVVGSIRARDTVIVQRMRAGSPVQNGVLDLYQSGATSPVISLLKDDFGGGQIWLRDEAGNITHNISADANGEGGYLNIYRSASNIGFTVDGNYDTNEPLVAVTGSSRSAIFDMSASSDSSVMLPASSISSSEMYNEAGMAWTSRSSGSVSLGNTPTTLLSRSCRFPSSGQVLVIATFYYDSWHIAGTEDNFQFGVSNAEGSFPSNQGFRRNHPASWSTFNFQDFATVQAHYSVDAGIETFYLLGQAGGATNPFAGDAHLSVLFFPTSYNWILTKGVSGNPEQDEIDARIEAKVQAESERLRKEFEDELKTIRDSFEHEMRNGEK